LLPQDFVPAVDFDVWMYLGGRRQSTAGTSGEFVAGREVITRSFIDIETVLDSGRRS